MDTGPVPICQIMTAATWCRIRKPSCEKKLRAAPDCEQIGMTL